MKVILQAFEPLHRPIGDADSRVAVTKSVRKSRIQLNRVFTENRLFHAWRA